MVTGPILFVITGFYFLIGSNNWSLTTITKYLNIRYLFIFHMIMLRSKHVEAIHSMWAALSLDGDGSSLKARNHLLHVIFFTVGHINK